MEEKAYDITYKNHAGKIKKQDEYIIAKVRKYASRHQGYFMEDDIAARGRIKAQDEAFELLKELTEMLINDEA